MGGRSFANAVGGGRGEGWTGGDVRGRRQATPLVTLGRAWVTLVTRLGSLTLGGGRGLILGKATPLPWFNERCRLLPPALHANSVTRVNKTHDAVRCFSPFWAADELGSIRGRSRNVFAEGIGGVGSFFLTEK